MYNLFLDDERNPRDVTWIELPLVEWVIARNFNHFTDIIKKKGPPLRVSFDHDLAEEHYPIFQKDPHSKTIPYDTYKEKTGYHCAKWLVDYCSLNKFPLPQFFIHTLNPIGKENIASILNSFLISQQKQLTLIQEPDSLNSKK